MAIEEHLARLKQGVKAWNQWRHQSPEIEPDRVADDLDQEAVVLVVIEAWCVHAPSMAQQVSADKPLNKLTMPLQVCVDMRPQCPILCNDPNSGGHYTACRSMHGLVRGVTISTVAT
jgi:hypothetical protein